MKGIIFMKSFKTFNERVESFTLEPTLYSEDLSTNSSTQEAFHVSTQEEITDIKVIPSERFNAIPYTYESLIKLVRAYNYHLFVYSKVAIPKQLMMLFENKSPFLIERYSTINQFLCGGEAQILGINGIIAEIGEAIDCIKKVAFHSPHVRFLERVVDEIGDVLFYSMLVNPLRIESIMSSGAMQTLIQSHDNYEYLYYKKCLSKQTDNDNQPDNESLERFSALLELKQFEQFIPTELNNPSIKSHGMDDFETDDIDDFEAPISNAFLSPDQVFAYSKIVRFQNKFFNREDKFLFLQLILEKFAELNSIAAKFISKLLLKPNLCSPLAKPSNFIYFDNFNLRNIETDFFVKTMEIVFIFCHCFDTSIQECIEKNMLKLYERHQGRAKF